MKRYKIGFIGAGNMAGAIIDGILCSGIFDASEIIVGDIDEAKLRFFKNKNIECVNDGKLLFKTADYIVLAVKPQVAEAVFPEIGCEAADCTIISIMAGIGKTKLRKWFPNANVRIARVMPNLPCKVKKGMSALDLTDLDGKPSDVVKNIFDSLGETVLLKEDYFDAVTAISGSGPAYVYSFIKAMIDGGTRYGIEFDAVKKMVLQTFVGAIEMCRNSDENIDVLIKNVCSKGGTTICAVDCFKNRKLSDIIIDGMDKCKARSEELSK